MALRIKAPDGNDPTRESRKAKRREVTTVTSTFVKKNKGTLIIEFDS